jgi:putative membrane protein
MFWGHGFGMGWGWLLGFLLMIAVAALIVLVVRSFTAGPPAPPTAHGWSAPTADGSAPRKSTARVIAEERLARGEITPDQYREIIVVLDEGPRPPGS